MTNNGRTGLVKVIAVTIATAALGAAVACSSTGRDERASSSGSHLDEASGRSLRVIDPTSGAAIAGATTHLLDAQNHVIATGTTDGAGSVIVHFPAPGRYTVTITKRGRTLGLVGFDTSQLPQGDVAVPLGGLQAPATDSPGVSPAAADVESQLGRGVIESTGDASTSLFYFQGPTLDGAPYATLLFGDVGQTYRIAEIDPDTLVPLVPDPTSAAASSEGLIEHPLSDAGRAAMPGRGVLVAATRVGGAPTAPTGSPTPSPDFDGQIRPQTSNYPLNCGPANAVCGNASVPTGFQARHCGPPPVPTCGYSFTASVTATISGAPGGIGIAVSGTVGGGPNASIPHPGDGTYNCDVYITGCGWPQPGRWVATQGWGICTRFVLGRPVFYPCQTVYNVWVPMPCGGTNTVSNGLCTCVTWSLGWTKLQGCDDGGSDGGGCHADASTTDAAIAPQAAHCEQLDLQ